MAVEQLTLFQKIYDFFLFLHPLVSRFPKNQRFVLGQIIEKEASRLLALTIQANKRKDAERKDLQNKISDGLDITRVLLRLSCDLKFISIKQYGMGVEKLNEIGKILAGVINRSIDCPKTISLIEKIITTHETLRPSMNKNLDKIISVKERRGLPIGNLTSQLFANVYMNELDHFAKEKLKARWYGRYMDDFVIIDADKERLKLLKTEIVDYLAKTLGLTAHPRKTFIGNSITGIDFLGYRIFHDHILVRAKTLRKFYKGYKMKVKKFKNGKLDKETFEIARDSFAGHLKHADTYWLQKSVFGNMSLNLENCSHKEISKKKNADN